MHYYQAIRSCRAQFPNLKHQIRAQPLINIHDLAVVPECRGQGVGRALLQAIEEEARRGGCCRLTLEVRADNRIARGLYQSFGFQPGNAKSDALAFWKKSLE